MSVEECAKNYGVEATQIGGLQDRGGRFAGMLAAFCERLGYRDLEALIAKFQVSAVDKWTESLLVGQPYVGDYVPV